MKVDRAVIIAEEMGAAALVRHVSCVAGVCGRVTSCVDDLRSEHP